MSPSGISFSNLGAVAGSPLPDLLHRSPLNGMKSHAGCGRAELPGSSLWRRRNISLTLGSMHSAPSWGDFGDVLQGAAQALGCSQLWGIIGAVFGEHTRLKEMFSGVFGTGGGGSTALIKKNKSF